MRKYLLIIAFLFVGISSQSQVLISLILGDKLNSEGLEFGLEGGFNWSNVSGLEAKKSLSTFNLGFYFDIRLKNQWYLYTGVLVKSKLGVDKLSANDLDFLQTDVYKEEGDYSQVMNYFLVPAMAKYKFKNNMYVEAGPQFGLMYKAWVEFNSDVDGKKIRIREDNEDMINRLDAGILAGLGYAFLKGTGITFGIKYYYGFVDVYKDKSGTNNSSFFLKMNIPIGAGKKQEKNKNNKEF
ncbi:MAG: PorT family protein [Bacteroidetes bacterium]|nr:PorT family protein [Bacteroidota bacterium]